MLETETQLLENAISNPKVLHSIFDRVEVKNHLFKEERRSSLPKALLTADGLATDFRGLEKTDLQTDLARLGYLDDTAHADTLPYLLQKYGWRIADPEDPAKYPDEAFCDRYRAAQALAEPGTSGGYLLVKGDLTGIQDYIYHNIQAGKTGGLGNLAKRLRARSVLVSLLTDFIANVILRELGLSSWHLLFAGGGHFNLLLPDNPKTKAQLKITAENLDKSMRTQFDDRLELIVAQVEVANRQELEKNASTYFAAVNTALDREKYTQHRRDLADLFERTVEKGKKLEIRIGGMFPKQRYLLEIMSKDVLLYKEPTTDGERWGDLILAEFTAYAHHTLLAVESPEDAHQFLTKNKAIKGKDENIQSAHILALNDTDFLPTEDWKADFGFPVSFGFRFLGKNAPRPKPLDEHGKEIADANEIEDADLLDFNQIAQIGHEGRQKGDGFVRLGSLMLDVDNLGLIFCNGIKDASLAQIITLSREMNFFFTAHFDQRAKENRVYVVYSGGDDAFAVGKWDMLMHFAKILREDFQKFICYEQNKNPDVHFSAGIFMSNPHYPVGRFYQDTKDLQERAKDNDDKNMIDVFGHTLEWKSYIDKIILGDQLIKPLKKGITLTGRKFSTSFAYRIMQLVKTSYYDRGEWDENEKKYHRKNAVKMEKFSRNIALMRYLFAKNGFTETEIERIGDDCEKELIQSFLRSFNFEKPYEARDYLVALNFAMLQVRSTSKNI